MAPPFPSASLELDYPLYALDFDHEDATRLVVSGGGGAGRSGVGNKTVSLPLSRDPSFLECRARMKKPRTDMLLCAPSL